MTSKKWAMNKKLAVKLSKREMETIINALQNTADLFREEKRKIVGAIFDDKIESAERLRDKFKTILDCVEI